MRRLKLPVMMHTILLALNQRCASLEREGRPVTGPGLPVFCEGDERFQSDDCLKMP